MTHAVKIKRAGQRRWYFLSGSGYPNRLRVHAARFTEERAQAVVKEIEEQNKGEWVAKVVEL